MPLDTVEPIILTITTEDKNSQKDEIVLQYNPDGEEKLEKLTENHDKHDYVTVDVPGMDLAINVSSSLSDESARYTSRHVPGVGISPYPVSSYLSKWIKPGAK